MQLMDVLQGDELKIRKPLYSKVIKKTISRINMEFKLEPKSENFNITTDIVYFISARLNNACPARTIIYCCYCYRDSSISSRSRSTRSSTSRISKTIARAKTFTIHSNKTSPVPA